MSDDEAIKAQIAALEGRINKQKQQPPVYQRPHQQNTRWHPYQAPTYYPRPTPVPKHRNRTLVVKNASATTKVPAEAEGQVVPLTTGPVGISTRDRGHMQWTSASVFDQKTQEKQKAVEQTLLAKKRDRDARQKDKIIKHIYGAATAPKDSPQAAANREIVIGDLRFRVASDGSKLIRLLDGAGQNAQQTPKQHKIAGVLFVRSRHGNLLRSGLVTKQRENNKKKSSKLCPSFTSTGTILYKRKRPDYQRHIIRLHAMTGTFVGWPRITFTDTFLGACSLGNRCRFTHDINKLAICKEFLRHGQCAAGEEACNLSHDPTPNRVPACTHFLRGSCTKEDCRYAHVHVNPAAAVCRDFAVLGYCDKGAQCLERHVTECPDYSNTGVCRNNKCRLPHIDRAGNLRKAAALKAQKGSDEDASDLSSDEEDYAEIDSDDVDSDDMDEDVVMGGSSDNGPELGQQQDFISF